MTNLIIIRGALGIGKSTISKMLVERLNGKYYSIDEILEENNLDNIDEVKGKITDEDFIKGNTILIHKIKKEVNNNQTIIVDGNFYSKKALIHLISKFKTNNCKVFTLISKVETCILRDSKREKPHGKDAAIAVHKLVSEFNYGQVIENEGDKPDHIVDEILTEININ